MPGYRVFLLQIYRPRVQLRLHDAERFLDSPKIMVSLVDFPGRHIYFRSDEHVVSGKLDVFLDQRIVHRYFHFSARVVSLFVRRRENDILRAVPVLRPFGLGSLKQARLLHFLVDLGGLLLGQLRIKGHDPFFADLDPPARAGGRVSQNIFEIVDAFLDPVPQFPVRVFNVSIIVGEEDPCLFDLRQLLHGFGEDVAVAVLQRLEDIFRAVQPFVRDLDGPPRNAVAGFQAIDDAPDHGLFALVPRKQLHAHGDQVRVEEEAQAHEGFPPVFLGGAFPAETVFFVYLEIEVSAIEIRARCVEFIKLAYLVVIDFDDFFVFASDVCQPVVKLVQRKTERAVQLRKDLFESPRLGTRADKPGVDQGRHHVEDVEAEVRGGLHQVDVFLHGELVVDVLVREITEEHLGRFLRDLPGLHGVLGSAEFLVQLIDLFLIKGDGIVDPFFLEFVHVSDGLVGFMGGAFSRRVVKAFIDLQVSAFFEMGFF